MSTKYITYISTLVAIFITSCASGTVINYEVVTNNKGLNVTSRLYKTELRDISNTDIKAFNVKANKFSYVYGKIAINNTLKANNKYNLGQYKLSINNMTSSGIYVDSVASYIIRDEVIGPNETITKSVYWVFDGEIHPNNMKNIKLVILPE